MDAIGPAVSPLIAAVPADGSGLGDVVDTTLEKKALAGTQQMMSTLLGSMPAPQGVVLDLSAAARAALS